MKKLVFFGFVLIALFNIQQVYAQLGVLDIQMSSYQPEYYGKSLSLPSARIIFEIDPDSEPILSAAILQQWILSGQLVLEGIDLPDPSTISIGRNPIEFGSNSVLRIPLILPETIEFGITPKLSARTGYSFLRQRQFPVQAGYALIISIEIDQIPANLKQVTKFKPNKNPYLVEFDRQDDVAYYANREGIIFESEDDYPGKDVLAELRAMVRNGHISFVGANFDARPIVVIEHPTEIGKYRLFLPCYSPPKKANLIVNSDDFHNGFFEMPKRVEFERGKVTVLRVSINH